MSAHDLSNRVEFKLVSPLRPAGRIELQQRLESIVRLIALHLAAAAVMTVFAFCPARANDAVAECKAFFDKFEKCVDGLKGDQQQEARIFLKTLRGTLGMADDLNQGDPMMIGIL
ncbi:MAG: hypothetical protein ABW006_14415, partial [Hyphomicrobium sp.]